MNEWETCIDEWATRCREKDATIAALQARVQELEAIKIPDDAFTYCAYCGEKSPVDEHNEDLAAHIKVCPKHPMRDVEAQLTQRTAELEAAKREVDVWKEKAELRGKEACAQRAELERVSLLSSHNERRFEMLEEKYKELRTLLLALPKVEGEITVSADPDGWYVMPLLIRCVTKEQADGIAALLQERQKLC